MVYIIIILKNFYLKCLSAALGKCLMSTFLLSYFLTISVRPSQILSVF